MTASETRNKLFELQDIEYRDFQSKLIPSIEKETVIGVRTPVLRYLAKVLKSADDIEVILQDLPHKYFEENQLHAFIISLEKDFDTCIEQLEKFLPYIDNWATCDQLSPKVFKKHKKELLAHIDIWTSSNETYTVRFGIGMLMEHYLDEDFEITYPELVASIKSEEYYVNMMIAWYFATALAKQYESVLPFIEERRLEKWTHNKAIQKAIESRRITDKQKIYLRQLKIR